MNLFATFLIKITNVVRIYKCQPLFVLAPPASKDALCGWYVQVPVTSL
jgi:hypothetical protein